MLWTPTSLPIGRRLWMVLLTGLPFAIFKFGGGLAAMEDVHPVLGATFAVWGVLDAVLNLAVLVAPERLSFCVLSNLGRMLDRRWPRPGLEELLLAVDTLATFLIVSTMIWFGRSSRLPEPLPALWTLCVIANILGVGIERVWQARLHRRAGSPAGVRDHG